MTLRRRLDRVEQQLEAVEAGLAGLPAAMRVAIQWIRLLEEEEGLSEDEVLR